MKKIFVLSVGRSDYDRYYPILSELNKNNKVILKYSNSRVKLI